MYPVGVPQFLPLTSSGETAIVRFLSCNRERELCAVAFDESLALYFTFPPVCLVNLQSSKADVEQKGFCERLLWKPDSTSILASTSRDFLLLYKVSVNWDAAEHVLHQEPDIFASTINLSSRITCFVTLKEEFLVGHRDGVVHRFLWDGQIVEDLCWSVGQIPFFNDQAQSRPQYACCSSNLPTEPLPHFLDICYSSFLGGFLVVLDSGRAALVTAPSPRFHPTELRAIWAPGIFDACCCSANHRYRLMAFGCLSSTVYVCHTDDTTGAILLTYQADLSTVGNPELTRNLGGVQFLDWSPSGGSLVVTWKSGGIGCWSVFGSRLWFKPDLVEGKHSIVRFDWGREGHHAWMISLSELFVLLLLKSCDCDCLAMEDCERIVLHTHDRIFLSPENRIGGAQTPWPLSFWHQIHVPTEYLSYCWPVRSCHFDPVEKLICVAGTRGFTYYSITSKKWRLFGSEVQERQFIAGSSLRIWRGFLLCACFDFEEEVDELRFYPMAERLENTHCVRVSVEAPVLLLTVRDDVLMTFDMGAKCTLFTLDVSKKQQPMVRTERRTIILLSDLVPHPFCVTVAQVFSRGVDSTEAKFCNTIDTVLVNIAGRLIMLTPQAVGSRRNSLEEVNSSQLDAPLLIASFVEEIWCGASKNAQKSHLSHAIWINSGNRGVHVWMPLIPRESPEANPAQSKSFISKWIMLAFDLKSIYPLVVCSLKCFFLGVESETDGSLALLEYKREVFLHHILKQLLKRNLGVYAWDIATTCRDLPYFEHVLELLLHSVLEEEGTCSDPIPDPLLPRVVEFLREFPEFLQVIAHCARKTEMALWKYLFQVTGSPKVLFQLCLKEKRLETAASYFIILQSMESTADSKKLATVLLQAVLENCKWTIALEIIRFLKSIDPSDLDSPRITPLIFMKQSTLPRVSIISPSSTDDSNVFVYAGYGGSRSRHQSTSVATVVHADGPALSRLSSSESSGILETHASANLSNGVDAAKEKGGVGATGNRTTSVSMEAFVQSILSRHAAKLASQYRLYDLAMFALQVQFRLILWLMQERNQAAKVSHYPAALEKLQADFDITIRSMDFTNPKIAPATRNSAISRSPMAESKGRTTEELVGQLNLELLEDPQFVSSASREALLRFLQRVMLETGCFDWLLLISLVLNDLRTFHSAVISHGGTEYLEESVVANMKHGLDDLLIWAQKNSSSFVPLISETVRLINEQGNGGSVGPFNGVSTFSRKLSSSSSMSLASSTVQEMDRQRTGAFGNIALSAPGNLAETFAPQEQRHFETVATLAEDSAGHLARTCKSLGVVAVRAASVARARELA
uniref:Protein RIC1 homolog n=1 Tax=Trichuris muris TaxID=70415 RepID=A0A5S6QZA6_TRIMR